MRRCLCVCEGAAVPLSGGINLKDLKNLFAFEKLLQDTENELIRRAKAEGRVIIGMNC